MILNRYLYSQITLTFLPIFLGLFFITSVVFLVKIASLTSVVTINFFELFKFYSYSMPQIIFYTMPVSFFISLCITLAKLSNEYELAVITSFGQSPLNILKILFPLTLLVSIFLLIISVGIIPKAHHLTQKFSNLKKQEAKFNIKDSEFGQKFGDWLVYIESKDGNDFIDVKLFNTQKNKEQFVLSSKASLNSDSNFLTFDLDKGKIFTIENNLLNLIDYEKMYINNDIPIFAVEPFTTSYDYWKIRFSYSSNLYYYILVSIFPLVSLFLVVSFGYYNPRYEKNRVVFYSITSVVIYYILMQYLSEHILIHSIYVLPIIWLLLSYYIYSKKVKKEY